MIVKASEYLKQRCHIVSENPFIVASSLRFNIFIPDELKHIDFFNSGVELADDFDLSSIPEKWIIVE